MTYTILLKFWVLLESLHFIVTIVYGALFFSEKISPQFHGWLGVLVGKEVGEGGAR